MPKKVVFKSLVAAKGMPIKDADGRKIGTVTEVHEKEGDEGIVEVVGVIEDEAAAQKLLSGRHTTFSMGAQLAQNLSHPIKAVSMGFPGIQVVEPSDDDPEPK